MKNFKYLSLLILCIVIVSCSSNNGTSGDCLECAYAKTASETAGTASASLNGTYNLVFDFAQTGSPFTNGTKAKFTLDNNILTVEIEGKNCITLKNPIQTSPSEVTFKDNCRDNYAYAVSATSTGGLNEINVLSLSNTWYGQFRQ